MLPYFIYCLKYDNPRHKLGYYEGTRGGIYQMNSRVLSSLNIPEKLKSCFYTTYCDILLKQSVKINDGCALSQGSNLKR